MSAKQYPAIDYVRQCLRYEDGKLYWLLRPREHFATDRAFGTWNARYSGNLAGWPQKGHCGYISWCIGVDGQIFKRSAIVWALHKNEWRRGIDHKNVNSLDDRIENLRLADQSQNNANCRMRKRNKSGYKGVSWHAQVQKWQASIQIRGKSIGLGVFIDPAEAHAAYLQAARDGFGAFAHDGF